MRDIYINVMRARNINRIQRVYRGHQYFIFYFYVWLFTYTYDDYLTIPNYNIQYPNEGERELIYAISRFAKLIARSFADEVGEEETSLVTLACLLYTRL